MLLAADPHPVGLQSLGQAADAAVVSVATLGCLAVLAGSFLAERRSTGQPSFVTRYAERLAVRTGGPLWSPLPFLVTLGGLALALCGWRAGASVAFVRRASVDVALVGLGVAGLGG